MSIVLQEKKKGGIAASVWLLLVGISENCSCLLIFFYCNILILCNPQTGLYADWLIENFFSAASPPPFSFLRWKWVFILYMFLIGYSLCDLKVMEAAAIV